MFQELIRHLQPSHMLGIVILCPPSLAILHYNYIYAIQWAIPYLVMILAMKRSQMTLTLALQQMPRYFHNPVYMYMNLPKNNKFGGP